MIGNYGNYGAATTETPGKADGWAVVQQAVDTFGPLVTDLVGEITEGRRNTSAWTAGQIAKKQGQLASETDPVKRAKLEAEIKALKQQQKLYTQATDASMSALLNSGGVQPTVYTPPPATAPTLFASDWLPWVGLGMVAVLGAVALSQQGGKR